MNIFTTLSLLAALPPFYGHSVMNGEAAWYGRELRGKTMANGQPFDERGLTCATWFYPLGAELRVTCVETGRSVYVTCSDRGPAWRLVWKRHRVIDLSRAAFTKIADLNLGHVIVRIERIESAKIPIIKITKGFDMVGL